MYKLTGYHSHRHPFYGYGDEIDIGVDLSKPLSPGIYEALAADDTPSVPAALDYAKIARPFVGGLAAGAVAYFTAKAFAVDKKKSMQVAFVIAGINLVFGIVQDYLYNEMEAAAADTAMTAALNVKEVTVG